MCVWIGYVDMGDGMQLIDDNQIKEITPEIVAYLFCEMDAEGQAKFYNEVAKLASVWPGSLCMQMQAITDESGLTLEGRRVMQMIGEYSHWGLVPNAYKLKRTNHEHI